MAIEDERVRVLGPVAQAVALLLGPYAEVVLHDVATDLILAIWNPMGDRGPGDPSLLGELAELAPSATDVFGPYEKILTDGRRLSSVSAVLRAPDGAVEAVLCINLDRGPLEQAAAVLSAFAAPCTARPEPLFEQDWTGKIQQTVGSQVRSTGRSIERLNRADRLQILRELDESGVLAVRRSTPVIAAALKISRSGLYSLLAELRTNPTPSTLSTRSRRTDNHDDPPS